MAATTWTREHILSVIVGKVFAVLEKADGSFVAPQAGAQNGLAIEGVASGTPVPVSGEVTATVDTSALATHAKQDTLASYVVHGTWAPATAAAAADSAVIRNSATTVRKVIAANSHATTKVYLQLFDLAAVPADGVAPRLPSIPIEAGQTVILHLGGMACANGLCWASSSTVATKTITAITPLQVSAELV